MVIALVSKPGLTGASALSIPKAWDSAWFRGFINNLLKGGDVRNAVGSGGIVVSGTIASPYATIGFGAPVTLPGPVTITGGGLIIGAPAGGNEGTGTVNATGFFLNGVNQFQTGTFTGTLTGMTGTTTGTVTYTISGKTCTLTASITGTSNTTAMTMTGLPAVCQPASQRQFVPCNVEDNGANVAGHADVVPVSGTVTFGRGVVTGTALVNNEAGFTASGTKGLNVSSFTYSLL